MMTTELERRYLANRIPDGLLTCSSTIVLDKYVPEREFPNIRIRQQGDECVVTKKTLISGTDSSRILEQTIDLDQEECETFLLLPGRVVQKRRYLYLHEEGIKIEVDVFLGGLIGLVTVDFEFSSEEALESFTPPDYCIAEEVTQEKFLAGGFIAGKSLVDIETDLARYNFTVIDVSMLM